MVTRRRSVSPLGPAAVAVILAAAVLLLPGPGPERTALAGAQPSLRNFFRSHGYLVPDPIAYGRRKALVQALPGARAAARPSSPQDPTASPSFGGQREGDLAPPDPTGAAGPHSFVQFVNLRLAIYDRQGNRIAAAPVEHLVGGNHLHYSDPQVLWDPDTQRFYYLIWDTTSATFRWGFSKTDDPATLDGDSWCTYFAGFGYDPGDAPDYPKLGTTKDFLLIGVNFFQSFSTFEGGDLLWIAKPQGSAPVVDCPSSLFAHGRFAGLRNADGSLTNAPEPAQQTDPSRVGWVVATGDATESQALDFITLFRVSPDPTGAAPRLGSPRTVHVPPFSLPAAAEQCQGSPRVDTLDGRFERAVSAVDPTSGRVEIWTAHAVLGGAGAEERWYEITPHPADAPSLLSSGVASSSTLYVYNGAVAPDRTVTPGGSAHGDTMVMGFNTSSATKCPAIRMVSRSVGSPQSAFVNVRASSAPDLDSSCSPSCRWGDYSGAAPDPGAPLEDLHGAVWLTNEWVKSDSLWATWIWRAAP